MAFAFLNNFSTVTFNPLTPGNTTLELQSGFADVKAAVDSGDTLVLTLFKTNESGEETGREVIHVTAADAQAETLTIERGKEGTADGDWESGTGIEQRLTAGTLQDSFDGVLYNNATAENATAVGYGAAAGASESLALGSGPEVTVAGGAVLGALPYTPGNMLPASTEGNYASPAACRQASAQVTLTTHALDLTDATAAVDLEIPAGAMLFIDSIDVVLVGSDSPGGSPEITIGPDDTAPAEYLAATAVSKTAVGGRESHDPLVLDGVTSLRVATSTAGSGTAYKARVVFRGYVMEL